MSVGKALRGFCALLRFLTTLPIGSTRVEDAATAFFTIPLLGLIEGFIVAIPSCVAAQVDPELGAAVAVTFHIAITGGMHLDGFADYVDGCASRKRGEEMLKVMKDPRKGSFAVIGLVLVILLSYIALRSLLKFSFRSLPYILAAYIASAESMFILASSARKPPYRGLGELFVEAAHRRDAKYANIVLIGILSALFTIVNAIEIYISTLALALLVSAAVRRDSHNKLGFVNGDVLGFCYETTRICSLLLSTVFMRVCS